MATVQFLIFSIYYICSILPVLLSSPTSFLHNLSPGLTPPLQNPYDKYATVENLAYILIHLRLKSSISASLSTQTSISASESAAR